MSNLQRNIPKHVFYEQNTKGRDFVIGDLHGCIADFLQALILLNFNPDVDRVFSVGDLVDRGPDSFRSAELVYEPWFFAVKGNHEEMMYETTLRNSDSHGSVWFSNGGQWAFTQEKGEMKALCQRIEELPFVISVGEGENRFNIVHAELKHSENWKRVPLTDMMLDHWVFDTHEEGDMLWGRTLISNGNEPIGDIPPERRWHDMDKLSLTFVGHTPVKEVVQVYQHMYIDTGAVYYHTSGRKNEKSMLTFACPTEKQIYQYNLAWKTMTTKSFDDIEKLG